MFLFFVLSLQCGHDLSRGFLSYTNFNHVEIAINYLIIPGMFQGPMSSSRPLQSFRDPYRCTGGPAVCVCVCVQLSLSWPRSLTVNSCFLKRRRAAISRMAPRDKCQIGPWLSLLMQLRPTPFFFCCLFVFWDIHRHLVACCRHCFAF